MDAIDFDNASMTFFIHNDGNIARIRLDAACTITNERTGEAQDFFLIAPCRAEVMYQRSGLFQLPNYEFCGIFAADECLLIRTHWQSDRDNREYGRTNERFERVALDIRRRTATLLPDDAQIVAATLSNAQLNARTTLHDAARGWRAVIEYPIKTMNVLRSGPNFQVDTGPILLPGFGATTPRLIECFDTAHVVYNSVDQAEFILRRPVQIASDGQPGEWTTDYSVVQEMSAQNAILRLV